MDAVLKVEQLLALTASDNIDEARNAAYAAAKLIRLHKLIVRAPAPFFSTSFPAPSVRVTTRKRKPVKQPLSDGWRRMKAKFAGSCKWCFKAVEQNETICWSADHGAYHTKCYEESGQ